MNTMYADLYEQLTTLIDPACSKTGNLGNIAALIYEKVPNLNWVGYYFLAGNRLILDVFQGKVACTSIDIQRGVCGKAFRDRQTIVVPDVHAFADHIACDSASNSEIVIPLWKANQVIGVFDIDAPILDRFASTEIEFFEQVAKLIETIL